MGIFIEELFEYPAFYFCWAGTVVVSVCIHEFSHAFTAHVLGDDTAHSNGFMTLNPLKVMGWQSLAALLLFGICWGAVPVHKDDLSRPRVAAICFAGPFSNLLLAVVAALLFHTVPCLAFWVACYANCMLFLFNILPIPVLDGWGTLEPFVPAMQNVSLKMRMDIFGWAVFILWVTPLSRIITKISGALAEFLMDF